MGGRPTDGAVSAVASATADLRSGGRIEGGPEQAHAIALALGVGLLYLLASWFSPQLVGSFGVPYFASDEYLASHSTRHVSAVALLRLPALTLLAVGLFHPRAGALRAALRDSAAAVVVAVVTAATATWLLDALHLWPWVWRSPGAPGRGYASLLMSQKNAVGLAVYFATWALANPLLEEVLFRFGVLRLISRVSRRPAAAIGASALAFSAAHFAGGFPPSKGAVMHAVGLFVMGVVLAALARWRQGRIAIPVAVHGARNGLEFVTMLISTAS